jgi:hypothetical protein
LKTKYAFRVGGLLYPQGTPVRRATLEEARAVWPNIEYKPDSDVLAVWFPDRQTPTLVKRAEVVLNAPA